MCRELYWELVCATCPTRRSAASISILIRDTRTAGWAHSVRWLRFTTLVLVLWHTTIWGIGSGDADRWNISRFFGRAKSCVRTVFGANGTSKFVTQGTGLINIF